MMITVVHVSREQAGWQVGRNLRTAGRAAGACACLSLAPYVAASGERHLSLRGPHDSTCSMRVVHHTKAFVNGAWQRDTTWS